MQSPPTRLSRSSLARHNSRASLQRVRTAARKLYGAASRDSHIAQLSMRPEKSALPSPESPSSPQSQTSPDRVYFFLRRFIHFHQLRPVASEPFLWPFTSRVDSHVRSVPECARRMI